MNNSIAVHSQTDLINIYNNECNNYRKVLIIDNTILISVIVITYSILNITS
jgi:hypothetical protein